MAVLNFDVSVDLSVLRQKVVVELCAQCVQLLFLLLNLWHFSVLLGAIRLNTLKVLVQFLIFVRGHGVDHCGQCRLPLLLRRSLKESTMLIINKIDMVIALNSVLHWLQGLDWERFLCQNWVPGEGWASRWLPCLLYDRGRLGKLDFVYRLFRFGLELSVNLLLLLPLSSLINHKFLINIINKRYLLKLLVRNL